MSTQESRPHDEAAIPKSIGADDLILGHDYAIRLHIEAILALLRPRCTRCLHPISAPESVRLGMGPSCRKAAGI